MNENNRLLRGIMEALSRKTPGIDLDTLTRAITGAQGGLRRSYGVQQNRWGGKTAPPIAPKHTGDSRRGGFSSIRISP